MTDHALPVPARDSPCARDRRRRPRSTAAATRAVRALDDVTVDIPARPLHRDHGPVGFRQVDADALPRRARHADVGPGLHRRHRARLAVRPAADACCAASASASCSRRSTSADAHRRGEHHAAVRARPGRAPRPASGSTQVVDTRRARRPARATDRRSCPGGQQQRVAVARALVTRPDARLRRRADRQPRLAQRGRGARASCARPCATWARRS